MAGGSFSKWFRGCLAERKLLSMVGMYQTERSAHVFASHLLLGELDLDKGLDCGEELPPWPVLHTVVLLDVFLDATDC